MSEQKRADQDHGLPGTPGQAEPAAMRLQPQPANAGTELCGICCENYSTHDIESDAYVGPICDDCDGTHSSDVAGPDDRKADRHVACGKNCADATLLRDAALALQGAQRREQELREKLTCRHGAPHYCPNCDNSIGPDLLCSREDPYHE